MSVMADASDDAHQNATPVSLGEPMGQELVDRFARASDSTRTSATIPCPAIGVAPTAGDLSVPGCAHRRERTERHRSSTFPLSEPPNARSCRGSSSMRAYPRGHWRPRFVPTHRGGVAACQHPLFRAGGGAPAASRSVEQALGCNPPTGAQRLTECPMPVRRARPRAGFAACHPQIG